MLEFVDSDLYFVQDKNDFINPLLQVGCGSGSGSVKKVPDPAGQKSPDPDPHPWVHEDDMLSSATPPGLLISRSV